jgi:hypothetical protein
MTVEKIDNLDKILSFLCNGLGCNYRRQEAMLNKNIKEIGLSV